MHSYILTPLFFVLSLFGSIAARSQCTPVLANDSSQLVVNGEVYCTAVHGNTLYAGGRFSLIGRKTGHFIGVDTATGKPLIGNWPKVNGNVYKVIADGTGGWIVGGTFSKVGDSLRNNIAQITAGGSVTSWNPNANGGVRALLLVNNHLYVGGAFTSIGGATRNRAARVSMATGIAAAWNPNASDTVKELQVYNSRIYVGGNFVTIGGATRRYIAKLDSVTGAAYAWDAAISGLVINSIAFRNSSVYIGGGFYNIAGSWMNGVACLDTGTALPTSWNPVVSGMVNKIVLNATTMYVGGQFSSVHSAPRPNFAEVSLIADTATSLFAGSGAFPVNDFVVSGSKIYLARSIEIPYSVSSDIYFRDIYQLDILTGSGTSWKTLADNNVNTLAMSGSILYAGGNFHTMGATFRPMAGAIDMDADTVTAWNPKPDYPVRAIAIGPSAVYLGGNFMYLDYVPHSGLAAVDFVAGDTVAGFYGSVGYFTSGYRAVNSLIYSGGQLYVAGSFDRINGATRYSLAILNGTTGALSAWDPHVLSGGYAPDISHIAIDGTNMYMVGTLSDIGGVARSGYGAVSLTTGGVTSWYPAITGGSLQTITVSNGTLYMGGSFDHVNGVFLPRLAKYNLATGSVSPWQPYPSGAVTFIKQQQNFAYVGGSFGAIHGVAAGGFGIVDTSSSIPMAWDPALNGNVNDLAFYNNKMYVAGAISSVSGDDNAWNLVQYKINTLSNIVTISGPTSICQGATAIYTVSATAPGSTFQWRVNGVSAGASGTTFAYAPHNGDQVSCVGHSVAGSCYLPDSAISNTITVTVNPFVTITGPSVACAGASVTDSAHTPAAGVTYQWKVNGLSVGTGIAHTYVPANGDHITVTIHGATGCPSDSATSDTITMTVNPLLDVLSSVTVAHDTICAGATATYVAHSTVGGLHYRWKVNALITGTDDSSFAYIPVDGDVVKCIATAPAGGCYIANPDSGSIHMVVHPNTHPAITTTGDSVLCAGATGTYSTTPAIAGSTYAWYTNGVSAGVTTSSYSYAATAGDVVNCIVTLPSTGCYSTFADTSSPLYIVVHPAVPPTATIATASATVCAGTAASVFTATPGMTGAGYEWQVNGTTVGGSTSTYTYVPADGDNIKCVVTVSVGSCFTSPTATSNTITMTVSALTVPSISLTAPTLAVPGDIVTVNATVSDAGPSYLITWYKNGSFLNTSTVPVTTYVKGSGTDNITAKVASLSAGCYDTTLSAAVTVNEGVTGITGVQPNVGAITAYPNPFTEEVQVAGLANDDIVSVINAAGVRMNDIGISRSGAERVLTLRMLPPGLYLIRVTDGKGNDKAKLSVIKG